MNSTMSPAEAVRVGMQTSQEQGTSCRWPFCRPGLDTTVTQTASTTIQGAPATSDRPGLRANEFCQKQRDAKTAEILITLFKILVLTTVVTVAVLHVHKFYRK